MGTGVFANVGAAVLDVGTVSAGGVVGGFGGRADSGDGTKLGMIEGVGRPFGASVGIFPMLDGALDGLGVGPGLSVGSDEALGCFDPEEG